MAFILSNIGVHAGADHGRLVGVDVLDEDDLGLGNGARVEVGGVQRVRQAVAVGVGQVLEVLIQLVRLCRQRRRCEGGSKGMDRVRLGWAGAHVFRRGHLDPKAGQVHVVQAPLADRLLVAFHGVLVDAGAPLGTVLLVADRDGVHGGRRLVGLSFSAPCWYVGTCMWKRGPPVLP